MWLAGLVVLINAIGGILLFLWGPYFFSSTMAIIFAGFAVVQAATAGLAFLGMCNVSIPFSDYLVLLWVSRLDPHCVTFTQLFLSHSH